MRHSTVVPLAHDDVAQSMKAMVAVAVKSVRPKAMPLSVAVRPPQEGVLPNPFLKAKLTTGANSVCFKHTWDINNT